MLGMGGHQSAAMKNDEWLTPPEILVALGPFDLDPCAPVKRPWDMAKRHYSVWDNGLMLPWEGRVWCNPPYGRESEEWLSKLVAHGNGIALIFAKTETEMFFKHVWNKADGILFLRGRLHFHYVDGTRAKANAGAPSCLVAYGAENFMALERSRIHGVLIDLHHGRRAMN